ncbi:hypothetical protein BZG36_00126 [Bifiguratus adelaidae]|uniref:Sulfotransferase domain-containing protein n=1 Tax=Bifiguratus adelaidae TaxID=1938954 RepID=A0A261Y898_9FUNG|nr:hypothetical protein BZG36_00126 [Bifiguratus adelaidae]
MPLEVFCTGYGRTGTQSLKEALDILGYPCFHMKDIFQQRRSADFWLDLYEGKDVDWEAYFEGYSAAADWPAITFYKEIIERYPNAKIIHTTRDFDSYIRRAKEMISKVIRHGTFQNRVYDKEFIRERMAEHEREVLEFKGNENVLMFSVQEGWGPLCAFLGVPVPDVRFPHVNDTKEFQARLSRIKTISTIVNVPFGLALAWLAWLAWLLPLPFYSRHMYKYDLT